MTAFDNQENKTTTTFSRQVVGLTQPRGDIVIPTISCSQLNGEFLPYFYFILSIAYLYRIYTLAIQV